MTLDSVSRPLGLGVLLFALGACSEAPTPAGPPASTSGPASQKDETPSVPAPAPSAEATAEAAPEAAPTMSSSYFDFTADGSCRSALSGKEAEEAEQHGIDIPMICPDAVAGYDAHVSWVGPAGWRQVELRSKQGGATVDLSVCSGRHGDKMEVRSADGVPFAVILRQFCMELGIDGERQTGQHLVVRGLGGFSSIETSVDAQSVRGANAEAQRLADAGYAAGQGGASTSAGATDAPAAFEPSPAVTHARSDGGDLHGALDGAGACEGSGTFEQLTEWALPGGRALFAAVCDVFAYQSGYEWWMRDAEGGFARVGEGDEDATAAGAGWPSFDPATMRAERLAKARGLGDCGDFYVHALEGSAWRLVEHRSRECDDPNPEHGDTPPTWPLVRR